MKLTKILKGLSGLFFMLLWVPFAILMFKGPLSIAIYGPESVAANEGGFFTGTGIWIALIIFFAIGSTVLLVASLGVGAVSNRRLINTGQDALAKILAIRETGTRINGNPVVDISLEIRPESQPTFVAEARQTVSIVNLPSFQPASS